MSFFRFSPPSPTNLERFTTGTSSFSMIGRFSFWSVLGRLSVAFIMSIIRALASNTTKRHCREWLDTSSNGHFRNSHKHRHTVCPKVIPKVQVSKMSQIQVIFLNSGLHRTAIDLTILLIWYDMLYLCAPKSWRTASLICRTDPNKKKSNEETKNKSRDAQKKWSSHKVRGVSPEPRRESMVGKICELMSFKTTVHCTQLFIYLLMLCGVTYLFGSWLLKTILLDYTFASLTNVKFKKRQKYEKARILWHLGEKASIMTRCTKITISEYCKWSAKGHK